MDFGGTGDEDQTNEKAANEAEEAAVAKIIKDDCASLAVCYCNKFVRAECVGNVGSSASARMVCDNCGRPMLKVLKELHGLTEQQAIRAERIADEQHREKLRRDTAHADEDKKRNQILAKLHGLTEGFQNEHD